MKARLPVQVLPLKPEILLYRLEAGHAFALRFTPGGETAAPSRFIRRSEGGERREPQVNMLGKFLAERGLW